MPRSFLVKKYLKQKYDEDQIKLQAMKEANALQTTQGETNSSAPQSFSSSIDKDGSINKDGSNIINNNNNDYSTHKSIASLLTNARDAHDDVIPGKSLVTAPYTPMVGECPRPTPSLASKLMNGYLSDTTYGHTGVKTEAASLPSLEVDHMDRMAYHPPRRSVIVTNSNHPSNRNYSPYDVMGPLIAYTAGEQYMPYDYSLPRSADRSPPPAHAPVSSSASSPHHDSPASPAPAHTSSQAYIPLKSSSSSSSSPSSSSSSPPPAHFKFEPQPPTSYHHQQTSSPSHAGINSPRHSPSPPPSAGQAEFLPPDHPFNHPLIQQLINQRMHVPSDKTQSELHHHLLQQHQQPQLQQHDQNQYNDKSRRTEEGEEERSDRMFTYSHLAHNQHHQHHPHHHHHLQNIPGSERQMDTDSSNIAGKEKDAAYDVNPAPLDEGQGHTRGHHYAVSMAANGSSSILTPSHLAPIHTHPNSHVHTTFPPSPSPTIPSSSPTLPYSESKTHFVLPPPSPPTPNPAHPYSPHSSLTASPHHHHHHHHPPSPASPASSIASNNSSVSSVLVLNNQPAISSCNNSIGSNHLMSSILHHHNTSISSSHDDNEVFMDNDNDDEDENDSDPNGKLNTYTYDAFLISDGRSRKRSIGQVENKIEAGRMRYTCNECGKDYATSSNLSRHKQTHRALDSKNAKKCPHCDKVYVSMPALSMHILTHDLKHSCTVCGKTFSRPWLLQGHMRSHTGEKPFGCAHCGKAFADRSNLRAHMQTHSAFKHYACGKCNKSFALKSYLNKHLESSCVKE